MICFTLFNKKFFLSASRELKISLEEFKIYQPLKTCINYDVEVKIQSVNSFNKSEIVSNNPRNFFLFKDNSFGIDYYHSIIRFFLIENPIKVLIYLKPMNFLKKFLSIEYKNSNENLAQIFHELVAIPLFFFEKTAFPIHASVLLDNSQQHTIAFGGTGGVGKTSLELFLVKKMNYLFMVDDISIIDSDGYIYPNMAYPKIYGYNLIKNFISRNDVLKNESLFSKLHWFFHFYLRGPHKIRRKVNPLIFFKGKIYNKPHKLNKYIILFKTDVEKLTLEQIPKEKAIDISISIIENEYWSFIKNILWLKINAISINNTILLEKVLKAFNLSFAKEILYKAFRETDTYILKIPLKMNHLSFLNQTVNLLREL